MTTERFSFTGVAGTNHYLAIFNADGQVFDWNDSTFKALASATTKAAASTEQADLGGASKSGYIKDIDLSLLNSTSTPAKFRCDWYTDANATARVSETAEFIVASSAIGSGGLSSEDVTKISETHEAVTAMMPELTGAPPATPTFWEASMWIYMMCRNLFHATNTELTVHNDAGEPIATQSINDDGTTFIRNQAT